MPEEYEVKRLDAPGAIYSIEEIEKRKQEQYLKDLAKQTDAIVKYNLEHKTHFYTLNQVQEHARQEYLRQHPVNLEHSGIDDASIIHTINQRQADAATAGDVAAGADKKSAQSANNMNYVVKPAAATAGAMLGTGLTIASIPTVGVGATAVGLAGGAGGQLLGSKVGSYIDDKAGTSWVSPTLGFIGGMTGYGAGAAGFNQGMLKLGSRGINVGGLYNLGKANPSSFGKEVGEYMLPKVFKDATKHVRSDNIYTNGLSDRWLFATTMGDLTRPYPQSGMYYHTQSYTKPAVHINGSDFIPTPRRGEIMGHDQIWWMDNNFFQNNADVIIQSPEAVRLGSSDITGGFARHPDFRVTHGRVPTKGSIVSTATDTGYKHTSLDPNTITLSHGRNFSVEPIKVSTPDGRTYLKLLETELIPEKRIFVEGNQQPLFSASPEISISDFNKGITDPQQQLELLKMWRKRYPDALISKPSDHGSYLANFEGPVRVAAKLEQPNSNKAIADIMMNRVKNIGYDPSNLLVAAVDPETGLRTIRSYSTAMQNLINKPIGKLIVPLDDSYKHVGGWHIQHGNGIEDIIIPANPFRTKPYDYSLLHEGVMHTTDGFVMPLKSPKTGRTVEQYYKGVSWPSDIIDENILSSLYTTKSAASPRDARAMTGEMVKKLYQAMSERTKIPISQITDDQFSHMVESTFNSNDKLIDFLKSFDSNYLNSYARILESPNISSAVKTQYAERIKELIKYGPVIAAPIIGASTLNNNDATSIVSNKHGGVLKRK